MKKIFLIISILGLSSCAGPGFKGDFDCASTPGVQCKSISEVNNLVEERHSLQESPIKLGKKESIHSSFKVDNSSFSSKKKPTRSEEEILTIWIAAYEDENGIVHQPGFLSTVLKPAKWNF